MKATTSTETTAKKTRKNPTKDLRKRWWVFRWQAGWQDRILRTGKTWLVVEIAVGRNKQQTPHTNRVNAVDNGNEKSGKRNEKAKWKKEETLSNVERNMVRKTIDSIDANRLDWFCNKLRMDGDRRRLWTNPIRCTTMWKRMFEVYGKLGKELFI